MKYDDLTIQKLRELPIFDVCQKLGINLYGMGQLTKRAKCWYHDDQHPSMHVNKKKNIYKCFVCGKGGDVIRLVQDYENLSFVEACDWLVREFSVTVTNTNLTNPTNKVSALSAISALSAGPNKSVPSVCDKTPSLLPLHPDYVKKSLGVNSEFCQALVGAGYMTQQQMQLVAERYRLGMTKDGSVIFWEIDQYGHCHNGKLMHYLPDCHLDKTRTPTWAAAELKKSGTLPPDFENPHCLFGLHLLCHTDFLRPDGSKRPEVERTDFTDSLNNSCDSFDSCSEIKKSVSSVQSVCPNNISAISALSAGHQKPICVVESEKTAVVCSIHFPQCLWLSCGGLQMLKPELLAPLVAHKIVLFPDTDEKGDAYRQWLSVAQQAQKLYQFQYPIRVSPILELHATPSQKQRKIDIVDFIFVQLV